MNLTTAIARLILFSLFILYLVSTAYFIGTILQVLLGFDMLVSFIIAVILSISSLFFMNWATDNAPGKK